MKLGILLSVLLALVSPLVTKITRINQYVTGAQKAYDRKDFNTAVYFFRYLNDSLQVRDREVKINLAHAYFEQHKTQLAQKYYLPLLQKSPPRLASLLSLQLGVIQTTEDKEEALAYFKKALLLNPGNEEARYNYELLKKYLDLHPEEENRLPKPPLNKPQPKKTKKEEAPQAKQKEDLQGKDQAEVPDKNIADPQNTPEPVNNENNPEEEKTGSQTNQNLSEKGTTLPQQVNQGTQPGINKSIMPEQKNRNNRLTNKGSREESNRNDTQQQTTYDRLRDANITPEKAKMLLEAMREAEIQYLQQLPRKRNKSIDASKPNW